MPPNLRVLGHSGRSQFIQNTDRKFPGVAVQGDTLYLWLRDLAESLISSSGAEQVHISMLGCEIYGILDAYAELCRSEGLRTPFQWPDPLFEAAGLRLPD